MSYHTPEEIDKIKEEQRIRTTETVKTGVRLYFGFVGNVLKYTCLSIVGLIVLCGLGALVIAGINQAQIAQQQRYYANQQKNYLSTMKIVTKQVMTQQVLQSTNMVKTQKVLQSTNMVLTQQALQSTNIVLSATAASLKPPKYDLSGKWDWNEVANSNSWSGTFMLTQSGNFFSGSFDVPSQNEYGEKIINGTISDNQVVFTRVGNFGQQIWAGTVTEKNGKLDFEGDCEGAGHLQAVISDALKPPKYDISGKWEWNVDNHYSGIFTLTLSGNAFTGILDDTSVNVLGDKIVNGIASDNWIDFTRKSQWGDQQWIGTISMVNGEMIFDGNCGWCGVSGGIIHAVKK